MFYILNFEGSFALADKRKIFFLLSGSNIFRKTTFMPNCQCHMFLCQCSNVKLQQRFCRKRAKETLLSAILPTIDNIRNFSVKILYFVPFKNKIPFKPSKGSSFHTSSTGISSASIPRPKLASTLLNRGATLFPTKTPRAVCPSDFRDTASGSLPCTLRLLVLSREWFVPPEVAPDRTRAPARLTSAGRYLLRLALLVKGRRLSRRCRSSKSLARFSIIHGGPSFNLHSTRRTFAATFGRAKTSCCSHSDLLPIDKMFVWNSKFLTSRAMDLAWFSMIRVTLMFHSRPVNSLSLFRCTIILEWGNFGNCSEFLPVLKSEAIVVWCVFHAIVTAEIRLRTVCFRQCKF